MPFNFVISDDTPQHTNVRLFLDAYDFVRQRLDRKNEYPLMTKFLKDCHGDEQQVRVRQLPALDKEVAGFITSFQEDFPHYVRDFFDEFTQLIGFAIKENKEISVIPG